MSQYCTKCGNKIMLMTGVINLIPNEDPYESGIEEMSKSGLTEIDRHIIAHYCENCDEIVDLLNE